MLPLTQSLLIPAANSAVFKSAEKCGCPLKPGFTFNATANVDAFDALSCSPSFTNVPPEANAKRISGKGSKRKGAPRSLLADNSAKYYQPHNETVYSGTAVVAHGHVDSSYASGYDHELEHKLKHARVVYVGGFLNGEPVDSEEYGYGDREEGGYRKQLPFVTGGMLKLIVKA